MLRLSSINKFLKLLSVVEITASLLPSRSFISIKVFIFLFKIFQLLLVLSIL